MIPFIQQKTVSRKTITSTGLLVSFLPFRIVLFIGLFAGLGGSLNAQNGLRDIAEDKKIYIGNLISNEHLDDPVNFRNGLADVHLREEYNATVLENYMKMSFVLPQEEPDNIHELTVAELQATLTADNIESFLSNPDWADLRKRGHAMIWFNQAPQWLNLAGPTWTGQQVFDFSRRYILALGQICGDRIDEWDVINEAISDDAPNGQRIWRQGTWYRRANDGSMTDWGEATYENYIKMLFVWAREAQPQARLHINDYGIETFSTSEASKNRFMRDKAKALKDCGAPIDGVGFQSHLQLVDMVSATGVLNQSYIDGIEESIEDLDEAGLEVAITELDIRICDNERNEDFQEVAYQAYVQMALSQPNCHEVLFWGLRDEDNWITLSNNQFFAGCQDASIVEGDNYTPKPAYDGVAAALMALPDQSDFSFSSLNPGDGSTANCGGVGGINPAILLVNGPNAVSPGDQVTVNVSYLASDNQDVVVWFQLNADPFTVFSQVVTDVSAGSGTLEVPVDIPVSVPPGDFQYRYQVFISPDGEGENSSFSSFTQGQVTVLGPNSQLIISSLGPDIVSPGITAEVQVSYSAVEGQEIVVWFQLDQQPFTVFQEFRQSASIGQNEITAQLFIPLSVPIADDAYQFQTLLVPTGGGFPDRISNIAQTNVDVVMTSSTAEVNSDDFSFELYPNPTDGRITISLPTPSGRSEELVIHSALGQVVYRQTLPRNLASHTLHLDHMPTGQYWLSIRRNGSYYTTRVFVQ